MASDRPTQAIIGEAPAFLEMLEHVSNVAPLGKSVLVVGERGTGKELIASRLHFLSGRWEQSLVKVNCAALTESILESELFGHEAGAFTGAQRQHIAADRRRSLQALLHQLASRAGHLHRRRPDGPAADQPASLESIERSDGLGRRRNDGKVKRTVVPTPNSLSIRNSPPCSSTRDLAIGSPRPMPWSRRT